MRRRANEMLKNAKAHRVVSQSERFNPPQSSPAECCLIIRVKRSECLRGSWIDLPCPAEMNKWIGLYQGDQRFQIRPYDIVEEQEELGRRTRRREPCDEWQDEFNKVGVICRDRKARPQFRFGIP